MKSILTVFVALLAFSANADQQKIDSQDLALYAKSNYTFQSLLTEIGPDLQTFYQFSRDGFAVGNPFNEWTDSNDRITNVQLLKDKDALTNAEAHCAKQVIEGLNRNSRTMKSLGIERILIANDDNLEGRRLDEELKFGIQILKTSHFLDHRSGDEVFKVHRGHSQGYIGNPTLVVVSVVSSTGNCLPTQSEISSTLREIHRLRLVKKTGTKSVAR
jgi:hypothetical protein